MLGGAVAEDDTAPRAVERRDTSTKEGAQPLLCPPPRWWRHTRWWGYILRRNAEALPRKAIGRPIGEPDPPTRAADTQQLAGRLRLIGRKHHAKRGQDHIERPVREGQVFGIALAERHGEALGGRPFSRALQKGWDIVDAGDVAPVTGGRERGVATAGGHVEHPLAGAEINGVTEQFTHQQHIVADHGVVTGRPCLLLARFDRGKIWHHSLPSFVHRLDSLHLTPCFTC